MPRTFAPIPSLLTLIALAACARQPAAGAPTDPARVVVVHASPAAPLPAHAQEVLDDSGRSTWRSGDPIPERWLHPEWAREHAPSQFSVVFDTTKGEFVVRVERDRAPLGADRFFNLVRIGYYTDIAVFRAIPRFMVQFGIHGVPEVSAAWKNARISDDPVVGSNVRGTLTFAMAGPESRTTQLFINTVDNSRLDGMNFAPLGEVTEGMSVVDALYSGYGEGSPVGRGPSQAELQSRGNDYIREGFPEMDFIRSARLAPVR